MRISLIQSGLGRGGRMEKSGHRVLSVFFDVEASVVAEDSRSYAAAIEQKHGSSSGQEGWEEVEGLSESCG
ncbi:unnamed protein product [Linum trigynum]|uniref:Uncharacterized protein n=1 Tax=Linum trigynum TaxID=586398 RepID=A0AAV2GH98_9ROSI